MSLSTLWQDCLSQLQDQVSPMDLSTWLRPLQADVISQDQVVLYASNMFVKSWVENHYLAQIHQICQALAKNPNLHIIVKEGVKPAPKAVEPASTQTNNHQESTVNFQQESDVPTKFESHLNHKHLFENFVEGKSNQLARAVGQKLALAPGEPTANPFFLYGGTGLGKTHLLHAIGNGILANKPNARVLYIHANNFMQHMVKAMRERIIEWGGEVRFGSKVTDLFIENDRIVGVEVNGSERIDTTVVLSGVGHSARDTYEMLYKRNVEMTAKPFAIGVRIEHDQAVIDESQYGVEPSSLGLGAAEYSLVYHDKESGRTAYSFCMCPGGQVVASASEDGGVVVNGMSLYARDSGVANSAIVVNVGPDDFGTHPLDGVAFQREWERKAYELGGSNFHAPAQTVGQFLGLSQAPSVQNSTYSYEPGVVNCDLHDCLPPFVTSVLERALPYWGRRIRGFDDPAVCMTGVETRTSAPLRMGRNEERISPTVGGFYPMGEGAGYAGGIMSAALDGAETAILCMAKYAKPN